MAVYGMLGSQWFCWVELRQWQALAVAVGSGKAIGGVKRSKWDVREVAEVVVVAGAQAAVAIRAR